MTTETRTELTPERAADLLDGEFADLTRAQANYRAALANLEGSRTLYSDEGYQRKLVEFDAAMEKAAATVRERATTKLDGAQARLDKQIAELVHDSGLRGADQWAEASARGAFVETDVRAMQPGEIVDAYQGAKLAGDVVGVYLLGRFGLRELERRQGEAQTTGGPTGGIYRALSELRGLVDGDKPAKLRAAEGAKTQINLLRRRLAEPITAAEETAYRRGIAARFRLNDVEVA